MTMEEVPAFYRTVQNLSSGIEKNTEKFKLEWSVLWPRSEPCISRTLTPHNKGVQMYFHIQKQIKISS